MTDFLGNLILRSTGEPSPLSILQPRLPSLFEPVENGPELTALSPEPVAREEAMPTPRPFSAPLRQEMTIARPTVAGDVVEQKRSGAPVLDRNTSTLEESPRRPVPKTREPAVLPAQPQTISAGREKPVQLLPPPENPERTILPHLPGKAAGNILPAIEKPRISVSKPRLDRPAVNPLSVESENTHRVDDPTKLEKAFLQIEVRPLSQNPILNQSRAPIVGPSSIKAESNPSLVLQPVPMPPYLLPIPHLEPAREAQKVVEVHIGRIEVRAAPAPRPAKRAAQKTTMSLEEYLRSRPGDKP